MSSMMREEKTVTMVISTKFTSLVSTNCTWNFGHFLLKRTILRRKSLLPYKTMKCRTILFFSKQYCWQCVETRLTGGCCPVWIALGRSSTCVSGDSDDSYKQMALSTRLVRWLSSWGEPEWAANCWFTNLSWHTEGFVTVYCCTSLISQIWWYISR